MKYLDCVEIIVEKEKYANEGVHKVRLTRAEPITVSLAAFYRLACAYFCKAIALLQISRFAFRKKAAERNSSTSQTNKFLKV